MTKRKKFDPQSVPLDFWRRDDVRLCLARREIGSLFEFYLAASPECTQTELARLTEHDRSDVSNFVRGTRSSRVNDIDVLCRVADGLEMPDEARAARALGRDEQRSLALSVISSTHAVRGEAAEAARTAHLGLGIARDAGSAREIARQLRCVGFALFRAGQAAEALAVVKNSQENAEEMARAAGDPNNMIDIQSLVGAAHWHLGELDLCEQTVRRFLDACEQLPWERGKAYAIRDLAEVTLMRRAFTDSGLLLGQARQIAQEYRDVRQLVRIDLSDARLSLFRGRLLKARGHARKAAVDARQLSLSGEQSEAEATLRHATRALFMPWLWLAAYRRPRIRFTSKTVGGD